MQRLNQSNLAKLGSSVRKPRYDRERVTPGIVHIGIGAFHRAHMAIYIDDILASDPSWGIIGASLRRPDTKIALEPQDYLYSVAEKDAAGTAARIVGSVIDVIDASADSRALIAAISDPAIKILSLTVTEKGYCHDPSTGDLMTNHPDVLHDLVHHQTPKSVPGIIVAALAARRARGTTGLSVLSCDNLQANGNVVKRVVLGLAKLGDRSLADWIAQEVSFPSTMVDRIVPSTTEEDKEMIKGTVGADDSWPVVTEPFTQWIVEDHFVAGRPPLENVGVQMVSDVEPFEFMKLRMLNGSHSALAYLGLLSGYQTVSEAVSDTGIKAFLSRMMAEEVIPTLTVPEINLGGYCEMLLERFANPALHHRCAQIAMDGSQKLPQRVLAPLKERMQLNQPTRLLPLSLAAWIAHIAASAKDGAADFKDPLAQRLLPAVTSRDRSASAMVRNILNIGEVFGEDEAFKTRLAPLIEIHLERILSSGPQAAISAALAE